MFAGTRTNIDDIVRDLDGLFVMFDNKHGVTQFTETHQCVDESLVVTLMESDRWLVEHIKHADQARPNLRCKTNALCFAASKSRCRS
ncbi:unannotated protein [freshwater metagenome]|uniref:Unannotated protein n=1 Tax=freshwater metagenome TaxID=449393 RepID=A0A6J7NX05_9ZZZZ